MRNGKFVFPRQINIYTDGAIRPEERASGLAAIVRDEQNQIRCWWMRRVGALTCNEAEYAAVIFALEQTLRFYPATHIEQIAVFSDSRVVVDQMNGNAESYAPGMQRARARLQSLTGKFKQVTFTYISREQNRLADALAFEAVTGPPQVSRVKKKAPNLNLWEQFEETWRTE